MAAAPSPAPSQSSMGSMDPGYNSYQPHGPMYGSPPSNTGPVAHSGGGYGSTYGGSYGY